MTCAACHRPAHTRNRFFATLGVVGPENVEYRRSRGPIQDFEVLEHARHSVITLDELRALGLSDPAIARRVRAGRLHRRHPEVFAVGRPDLPLDGVFLAAVLACGPRAKLSFVSALRKWDLRGGGTYRIDVTAPRSIKPKKGIRLHRPLSLDDLETTQLDGIPITTVAQTLLDVAAPAYRLNMGKLLHESIVQELFDLNAIARVLARNPTAAGTRRLAEALTEEVPFTRSDLEDATLQLFGSFGIAQPECNAWISDGEKLVEVDFVWRESGLIVEVDGWRYHRSRWRRRQDAAKTAALEAQGWRVRRFWEFEITGTPAQVAATTLAAMHRPRERR
jgi:predicted transcriptional regulator of viral defense system